MSSRRVGNRSATAPLTIEKSSTGENWSVASSPRRNGEFVSCRTSQACATFCIQLPICATNCERKKWRKSAWFSARRPWGNEPTVTPGGYLRARSGSGRGQVRRAVRAPLGLLGDHRGALRAFLGRRGRRRRRLGEQAVHLLNQEEHGERHDDEVDHRVEEHAVVERRGPGGLRGGERWKRLPGQADEEVLEVDTPEEPADRRQQDVVDERGEDGG